MGLPMIPAQPLGLCRTERTIIAIYSFGGQVLGDNGGNTHLISILQCIHWLNEFPIPIKRYERTFSDSIFVLSSHPKLFRM